MPARNVLTKILAVTLLIAPAVAVGQGTGTGKPGTTTSTTTKAPSVRPPVLQEERRMVFLTGHVKVDDGTEPGDRAAIERVCNGRVRREAYADAHGAFGFQLGQMQLMQDASVSGMDTLRGGGFGTAPGGGATFASTTQSAGVSQRDLMGCELRASLAGYVSEPIDLAGRQLFDNPDVGTLVLHRIGKVEGTKISVTTMLAPPEAKKAFEHARKALQKNHKDEAERQLQKAIAAYPKFAEAMSQLGEIYADEGRKDEAEKMFRAAIEADPKFIGPYYNLAMMASERHDWHAMADMTDKALALDPYEYPALYLMNAAAYYNLHNLAAAEKSARTARKLDSQYRMPRIDFILANVLMQRDDYAGAAEELRTFLKYAPAGAEADTARQMLAQTQERLAAATSK